MEKGVYLTHDALITKPPRNPMGCIFKPFQEIEAKQQTELQMCRTCYFYCNPYCTFNRALKEWTCASCGIRTQIDYRNTVDTLSHDDVIEQPIAQGHPTNDRVMFVLTDRLQYALPGILEAVNKAPDSAEFLMLRFTVHCIRSLSGSEWRDLPYREPFLQPWLSKTDFLLAARALVTDESEVSQGEINMLNEFCDIMQEERHSGPLPPTHMIMFLEKTAETIEQRFNLVDSRYYAHTSAYERIAECLEHRFAHVALSVVSDQHDLRMVRLLRRVSARLGGMFFETPGQIAGMWDTTPCARDIQISIVMQRIGFFRDCSESKIERARATTETAIPLCLVSYGPDFEDELFISPKELIGMVQFVTIFTDCNGLRKKRVVTHQIELVPKIEAKYCPKYGLMSPHDVKPKIINSAVSAALLWHIFFQQLTDETDDEMQTIYDNHLKSNLFLDDGTQFEMHCRGLFILLFHSGNSKSNRFNFLQNSMPIPFLQRKQGF